MVYELSDEDLAFEIAEDNKLRSIGINPDGDPIDIMVQLERLRETIEAEHAAQKERAQKPD